MVRLAECLLERESLDGVEIRRIVAGLTLDDAQPVPDPGSDDDRPQLKEPSAKPLKPILPPITGGNPGASVSAMSGTKPAGKRAMHVPFLFSAIAETRGTGNNRFAFFSACCAA